MPPLTPKRNMPPSGGMLRFGVSKSQWRCLVLELFSGAFNLLRVCVFDVKERVSLFFDMTDLVIVAEGKGCLGNHVHVLLNRLAVKYEKFLLGDEAATPALGRGQ